MRRAFTLDDTEVASNEEGLRPVISQQVAHEKEQDNSYRHRHPILKLDPVKRKVRCKPLGHFWPPELSSLRTATLILLPTKNRFSCKQGTKKVKAQRRDRGYSLSRAGHFSRTRMPWRYHVPSAGPIAYLPVKDFAGAIYPIASVQQTLDALIVPRPKLDLVKAARLRGARATRDISAGLGAGSFYSDNSWER
jgi:hypothetical protein